MTFSLDGRNQFGDSVVLAGKFSKKVIRNLLLDQMVGTVKLKPIIFRRGFLLRIYETEGMSERNPTKKERRMSWKVVPIKV